MPKPSKPFDPSFDPRDHILFEDGEALVLNKPAGMPITRPRRGGPSLEDWLGEFRLGFQRDPQPVHRLDADTSGCLLLARNPKALKRFGAAFEARQVEKRYLGIVAGTLTEESGSIDLALKKISSREAGWRMVADPAGQSALTHWRQVARIGGLTLVAFRPETGRTHQIRIHALAGLGAALLGDPVYGRTDPRARRTMLHAHGLVLHRDPKPAISAAAPLPADFTALGFDDAEFDGDG